MLELLSVLMCGGGSPPPPPPPPPPPSPPPSPPAPIAKVEPKTKGQAGVRQKKRGKGLRQFRMRSGQGGPTGLNIG